MLLTVTNWVLPVELLTWYDYPCNMPGQAVPNNTYEGIGVVRDRIRACTTATVVEVRSQVGERAMAVISRLLLPQPFPRP